MNRLLVVAVMCAASYAFAQGAKAAPPAPGTAPARDAKAAPPAPGAPAAAPGMDMSKMGPWARKPIDEKKTKKEIEDYFKKGEELMAKGDVEAMTSRIDFPVYMATDDLKGAPAAKPYSKEEYIAEMKPFFDNMPKDAKTTHKPTITVLSDSLVNVIDDFTTTMGKQKLTGRNQMLLVKVGGEWKSKVMVEAGWGGMPEPKAEVKPPPPAPAPAPTPPAPKK